MASELSRFIEDELRNKGYAYDEDDAEANDNPHTSLIGALRVEARVKEQETQKKLFNIKRVVCIGGGVALVLIAWALLIASSRDRGDPGYQDALSTFEGYGIKIEGEDDAKTAAAIAKQVQQGADSSSSSSQQPPPKPPEETPAADAKQASGQQQQTAAPAADKPHDQPAADKSASSNSSSTNTSNSSPSPSPAAAAATSSPSPAAAAANTTAPAAPITFSVTHAPVAAANATADNKTAHPAATAGNDSSSAVPATAAATNSSTGQKNSSNTAGTSPAAASPAVSPAAAAPASSPDGKVPPMDAAAKDDSDVWGDEAAVEEYMDDDGDLGRRKRHRRLKFYETEGVLQEQQQQRQRWRSHRRA